MKQYAASPILNQFRADWEGYFNTGWQDELFDVVWNVDTAQGFGLDIWGRIVVIGRQLLIPVDAEYFGFDTGAPQSWSPFNVEAFYTGPGETQTFILADDAYRVLILAKALSNISATNSMALNQVLQQLFPGRGRAWVNDLGGMSMRFVFEFPLEPWELAVLTNGNVIPRPAGVGAYVLVVPEETFGFAADCEPFGHGTFLGEGAISNVT
jgi:hypothetical protein